MLITENISKVSDFIIDNVRWESKNTNPDLHMFLEKKVKHAHGTGKQILQLLKYAYCDRVEVVSASLNELKQLDNLEDDTKVSVVFSPPLENKDIVFNNMWLILYTVTNSDCIKNFKKVKDISRTEKHLDYIIANNEITHLNLQYEDRVIRILSVDSNIQKLIMRNINDAVIDLLGQTRIPSIVIDAHNPSNYTYDMTPLLSNPNIIKFKTNVDFDYDSKIDITLVKFKTTTIMGYEDIHEKCEANSNRFRCARTKPIMSD